MPASSPGTTCWPTRPSRAIDLISRRDLLIYLEPVLQEKIVPTQHYTLKPVDYAALTKLSAESQASTA